MLKLSTAFANHPYIGWTLLLGYIVFCACFNFPFQSPSFELTVLRAYVLFMSYACIGALFSATPLKRKALWVPTITFAFTFIGLVCRYLLEYGEVSNTMNFTPINVITFLSAIPIFCTLICLAFDRWAER